MAVTFKITGMDLVGAKLARLGPLFVQEAKALVAETVLFGEVAIADKIDEYEAVDTGRMKGSISAKTAFNPSDTATRLSARDVAGYARIDAIIGTNVSYAIPVHEGYTTRSGRKIEGRPFMEDAVPEIAELFERRARERLGGLLS